MSHRVGLSAQQRKALQSVVMTRKGSVAGRSEPERQAPSATRGMTDFNTLPGFKELKLQRSMAEVIGLDNPFFRMHDAKAGATTIIDGREVHNFSSYDYLGLNGHPAVNAAAKAAIEEFGTSTSASRLVAGERPLHRELERALADHYDAEACVVMVSGHATNVATIGTLLGPKDLILHDALAHNSIVTGALLSRADRRAFPHNDLDALEAMLAAQRHRHERVLIAVEGLYSMDGDFPNLKRLVDIKRRYDAWLMVDDAHGLGVLGARGRGLFEEAGVDARDVDIWMGTLSKTLSSCGGYVAGSSAMVEYLKCMAGGFVYSVGLAPPLAAAALTALAVMNREPERVERLRRNGQLFRERAENAGLDTGTSAGLAVIPVIVYDSLVAVALGQTLFQQGINVQPIIHPAVPERAARLRFFMTSEHTAEQIESVAALLARELTEIRAGSAIASGIAIRK
jgi:8-amino-7-oxononanoate synthase